jgi:hypothetical protein
VLLESSLPHAAVAPSAQTTMAVAAYFLSRMSGCPFGVCLSIRVISVISVLVRPLS